jgi:di/tricarboxylate transporter
VGRAILRHTGTNPNRLLVVIMVASAGLGAFMSNTASTAFFVPMVIGLAQRARVSPSRVLMPLAFASILSSSVTLVSTSSNIIISGLMTRYDLAPMGMFELAPVGIPIVIAGLVYMLVLGRRLIPERRQANDDEFGVRVYLTEVVVMPGSPLIEKTLEEAGFGRELDLRVLRVVREKRRYFAPRPSLELYEGDEILVEGTRDEIIKIKDISGIDMKADVKLSDPSLNDEEVQLAEVILMPGSPLIGRTLKGTRFAERYSLQILAINRRGETIRRKLSQVRLRLGDVLLVQGERANITSLDEENTFSLMGAVEGVRPNTRRASTAVMIFVGVLLVATFGFVSLSVAMLIGALAVFATRCITPDEAYRQIEWKAIILIGSMLALGSAMQATGAADYVASLLVSATMGANPLWLLAAFFVLTVILTQPMSNQAAAVVVVPIALQTAIQLGLNPRTFAMMTAVAASCSYLTPLEPSCLMVYGPGQYRFRDFLKVGSLLTIIIFVIALALVPLIWPLDAV